MTRGHLGKVRMEARFFAASHLLGPQASLVLTVFPQVLLPMASRCLILISVSFILWNPCSLSVVQCEGVWGTCLLFLGCPPLVWAVGLASAYTMLLLSTFSFGCVCLHSCHGSFSSHLCLGGLLPRAFCSGMSAYLLPVPLLVFFENHITVFAKRCTLTVGDPGLPL